MSRIDVVRFAVLLGFAFSCASCATIGRKWKALVSGRPDTYSDDQASARYANERERVASFSNTPNLMTGKERKYHRVTIDNFDDNQGLDDNAGSLWRKEGQGSYLFSQNSLRNIGDIINVSVDGKAAGNLNAKLNIIRQVLARMEPPVVIKRTVAANGAPKAEEKNDQAQGIQDNQQQNAAAETEKPKAPPVEQKFDDVPCRIVQRNDDGSYRVKGSSSVFVGRHEYKLIITGVVRPEDVSYDDAISSTRILDSKFDLVATNKELKR